jgi:hypothetical protein
MARHAVKQATMRACEAIGCADFAPAEWLFCERHDAMLQSDIKAILAKHWRPTGKRTERVQPHPRAGERGNSVLSDRGLSRAAAGGVRMVEDITLTPGDFAVLSRVPLVWWDENNVVLEISFALTETKTTVRKRLAYLYRLRLVERRQNKVIDSPVQIRRIAK